MSGRASLHIREIDGTVACYYGSKPRTRHGIIPPVCGVCGRTVAERVWTRAGWNRWNTAQQARKQRKEQEQMRKAIDWPVRVVRICTVRAWTREMLGEKVGSSPRTVDGWFQGRNKPDRRAQIVLKAIWREIRQEQREQAAQEGAGDAAEE